MNVIRMIKVRSNHQPRLPIIELDLSYQLFAWASYMNEKLIKKREDELKYQRKAKFLELIYSSIKFVSLYFYHFHFTNLTLIISALQFRYSQ